MNPTAEFIGRHAVAVLFAFAAIISLVLVLLWRVIQQYGDALWRVAARLWGLIVGSAIAARLRRIAPFRALLTRTFSLGRYLGIHALAGFAIAVSASVAFAELADEIGVDEDLAVFDEQLREALSIQIDGATLRVFALITHLGDRDVLLWIGVAVGVYLLIRRWWLHVAVWALATGAGGLLVRALKATFERTRPIHEHTLTSTDSWSFPSGHASGAMLVYGMLGYLIVRHTPTVWHIPVALAAMTLVVFVGFSRVILQVHYLSDVVAGFVVAGAWLGFSVMAFETLRRRVGTVDGQKLHV